MKKTNTELARDYMATLKLNRFMTDDQQNTAECRLVALLTLVEAGTWHEAVDYMTNDRDLDAP